MEAKAAELTDEDQPTCEPVKLQDSSAKYGIFPGKCSPALTSKMTSVSLQCCFYCECVVSIEPKSLREYLTDSFANLAITIRAAFSTPLVSDNESEVSDCVIDSEFIRWLNNDPMVTGNSASRYCDDAPGYMTRNGRGSLEIGCSQIGRFDD
jgi:hypothetical protein